MRKFIVGLCMLMIMARINATGGDDINANNYLVSTDQWSTAVIVASNGAYRALTSGTWAAHA